MAKDEVPQTDPRVRAGKDKKRPGEGGREPYKPKVREKREAKAEGSGDGRAGVQGGGGPITATEDYVRRRIAEALRRDGFGQAKIGLEILYLLPNDFVKLYEELFHKALMVGDEAKTKNGQIGDGVGKAKVGQPGNRAGVMAVGGGAGAKKYRTYGFVGDEAALQLKQDIDRKLRRLARDIRDFMTGSEGKELVNEVTGERTDGTGKCAGCKRYVDKDWTFCASCGTRIEG